MSDLYSIDSSKTIEGLRAARSYNDIVVVFGVIKSSIDTISNRIHKRQDIDQMLLDIRQLEEYSFALQFARTLNVVNDKKTDKYITLTNHLERALNQTIQQIYSLLNQQGVKVESPELKRLAGLVETYLSKTLNVKNHTSIVLPSESPIHYLIFDSVVTTSNYIINQFIVALSSEKQNNKECFFISFPTQIFQQSDKFVINSKTVVNVLTKCLSSDTVKILDVGTRQRRIIGRIPHVERTHIEDGVLNIELDAKIGAKEINSVLTQLLPQLYIALNITDPRRDIVHSVGSSTSGSKVIRVMLQDRNFYETKALRTLKSSLNLDADTYRKLQNIMR